MDGRARIARRTLYDSSFSGTQTPEYKYNLENHLGSGSVTLEANGAIYSLEEYFPFGETSFGSFHKKRYRYCGKERDEESGLYYYGARYYAAWTCRFVNLDPLAGEYPFYTPYQYAGNKPIIAIDLDGLEEAIPEEITRMLHTNLSKWNINTDLAPSHYKGVKTKVEGGRKWNPMWVYDKIDEIDPSFWSSDNKLLLKSEVLPTVDDQFFEHMTKGLSVDEKSLVRAVVPNGMKIEHHHWNHGRHASPIPWKIHRGAGYTKLLHSSNFRNYSSTIKNSMKTFAKTAFKFVSIAMLVIYLSKNDLKGAMMEASGLPTIDNYEELQFDFLSEGLEERDYSKIKTAVDSLEIVEVVFLTADEYLKILQTGEEPCQVDSGLNLSKYDYPSQKISASNEEKFPYMDILVNGKSMGIVEIPDTINPK